MWTVAAAWLAVGAAGCGDGVEVELVCGKEGEQHVYQLPDEDPETIASYVVVSKGASNPSCGADAKAQESWSPLRATGGKFTLTCPQPCPDGSSVTYYVIRQ
jgi:hypothetical protein